MSKSAEEWRATTLKKALDRAPERDALFDTTSHVPVHDAYTSEDLRGWDERERLGYPGEYPFTRGVQPTMYRGRLWTMRQYAGYATAEESNARFRYLLERGQTGLSVAFDLPTQMGYDADHPIAEGEVGKVGVSISSLDDMEELLTGLPLDKVTTSMTINATAPILLALYIAVAKKQGVDPRQISGTVQNDILKEYIARGTYIYPPRPSLRLITDLFAFCANEHRSGTISISGYHMREAGECRQSSRLRAMASSTSMPRLSGSISTSSDHVWCSSSIATTTCGEAVARRARDVGQHHARTLRGDRPAIVDVAFSYADRGCDAPGATDRQQRGPCDGSSAGGCAGRYAIASHQCQR